MSVMAESAEKGVAVTAELRRYLVEHSIAQPLANTGLVDATRQAMDGLAIMQIAEEQGPFLTWLARLIGTECAVEVGTFTGLSALHIAQGLGVEGRLTCFDINEDFVMIGKPFWKQAGVDHLIDVVIGPAATTLTDFHPHRPIDFVFIDADKVGYQTYYELLLPMMRPGGIILFDNALYFGAVLTESKDADATALRTLNNHVANDSRVEAVLLNVGDGLLMARKL
jgi:caffeoyl-CoA O-methyltransferase